MVDECKTKQEDGHERYVRLLEMELGEALIRIRHLNVRLDFAMKKLERLYVEKIKFPEQDTEPMDQSEWFGIIRDVFGGLKDESQSLVETIPEPDVVADPDFIFHFEGKKMKHESDCRII